MVGIFNHGHRLSTRPSGYLAMTNWHRAMIHYSTNNNNLRAQTLSRWWSAMLDEDSSRHWMWEVSRRGETGLRQWCSSLKEPYRRRPSRIQINASSHKCNLRVWRVTAGQCYLACWVPTPRQERFVSTTIAPQWASYYKEIIRLTWRNMKISGSASSSSLQVTCWRRSSSKRIVCWVGELLRSVGNLS